MPIILRYFLGGLLASLLVGIASYYFVGHASTPLLSALFGDAGRMWGRLYRIALVTIALLGGLSIKFYGCSGPTDYQAVAQSHRAMYEHASAQAAQSMSYTLTFLVASAAAAALAFAWLRKQTQ